MTVCVIATARTSLSDAAKVTALFETLQEHSRKEEGCIQYDLGLREVDEEVEVLVMEQWTSQAALDDHMTLPHFTAFQEVSEGLIKDITMHVYTLHS